MNDLRPAETVGHDVTNSPDPVNTPDPGLRALYDSDISASIQQKFASWYYGGIGRDPSHWNDNYFMVRTQQGEYVAYFGDISSDGTIADAERVTYKQVSSGGYSTAWTWSVAHVQSGRVDLDGYSGYIYSSYDQYQQSQYMVEYGTDVAVTFATNCLLVLCAFFCLFVFIRGLIRGRKH